MKTKNVKELSLKEIISAISLQKGLDESVIIRSIEQSILAAYKKFKASQTDSKFKSSAQKINIEVNFDIDTNQLHVFEVYEIVETADDIVNPHTQWTLEDAEDAGLQGLTVGEFARVEKSPKNFGRIAAQTARQVIMQRLKDAEKDQVRARLKEKEDNVITGVVSKIKGNKTYVTIDSKAEIEAIFPEDEKIFGEEYELDSHHKFYLFLDKVPGGKSRYVVSRKHSNLLRRLMAIEIPEIQEGVIEIKSVVREAGARSKVAVKSLDPNVDPVGACIGPVGARRLENVEKELSGEKIDIVRYDDDIEKYIINALSQTKVTRLEKNEVNGRTIYTAIVPQSNLSQAIGKAGQNVRLAARLTGCKIEIKPDADTVMPTFADIINN